MITEMVRMVVRPGLEDEFVERFKDASLPYYAQPGCLSNDLYRAEDDRSIVLGIVNWSDKRAQESAIASEVGKEFLARITPLMGAHPDLTFYTAA